MGERILIVDDEESMRKLFSKMLGINGFETAVASDAEEAIAALKSQKIDLILLDARLGRFSGLDLLKSLRAQKQWADLPVIMITASDDCDLAMQARQLSVQGYFLKSSFSMNKLVDRIRAQLALPKPNLPPSV